jgi:hypothetical protein
MTLTDVFKLLATSTVVSALVAALISYRLNRKLEHLKGRLARIDRLERDLLKSRGDAYGEIWALTGALNLFGPANPINCTKLSRDLTGWYFSKGQLLTKDSKPHYFLVQEVINFLRLRGISPSRPSDERLYSGENRTIKAVRAYRAERLAIPARGDEASYSFAELETYVRDFKSKCNQSLPEEVAAENAWLLLQFVMSAFRSCVTEELGSRDVVHSSPEAEATQAGGGL